MDWIVQCRQQVAEALTRLTKKGLVRPPGAGFSVRIPGQTAMAIGRVQADLGARASRPLSHDRLAPANSRGQILPGAERTDASATPGETPTPNVSVVAFDQVGGLVPVEEATVLRMHASIYRHRPDVGAILTSCLPWCFWLARSGMMPAVFDEQVRYLGPQVERLPSLGTELTAGAIATLKRGANAFLLDQETICLGLTAERALLNAELLEKCAQAYILASLTRHPVGSIPFYVRFIAARRLLRDEKRAAEAYARGELPFQPKAFPNSM
jgi:ribulose-5-phosphate 4-epimerase/fuculose-1-phosphate aldolase